MFDKDRLRGLIVYGIVIGLFIMTFIIIKPLIVSIIYGILFAYIFYPLFKLINSKIKNKTVSASILCIGLLIIITTIASFFLTAFFKQAVNFYLYFRDVNIGSLVTSLLPSFMSAKNFPVDISGSINSFLSNLISNSFKQLSAFVLELPIIILNLFVLFFVFFYALRDGKKAIEYIKSISPFNKETEEKFFKQFKDITNSVLIGYIVVGIIQGAFAGLGYFIFGVPNALLLTFLTMVVSIIPILGAWLGWGSVDIYLFATGHTIAGLGLLIYGVFFVSIIDNILRVMIVSKRTEVSPIIVLIGMIGGGLVFGFLGFIIGPLVLAYVLLFFDLYRKNAFSDGLVFKKNE